MSVAFNNTANNPFVQMLQQMGLDPRQMMRHLSGVQHHAGALRSMLDDFSGSANMDESGLQNLLSQGAIPGGNIASPPNASLCPCGGQYAQPQTFDFGALPGHAPMSEMALSNRMNGMKIESFIRNNPDARQALEARLGGRIIPDGMNDGVMRVQPSPFGHNFSGGGQHNAAHNAMTSLNGISRGAVGAGAQDPFGQGAYQNMMVGALANTMGMGHSFAPSTNQQRPQRRLFSVHDWARKKPIPGTFPGVEGGLGGGLGGGGIPGLGGASFAGGGLGGGGVAPANFAGGGGGAAPANFAGGGGGAAPANFAGGLGGAPAAPNFGGGFGGAGGVNGLGGGIGGGFGGAGLTIEDQVVLLLMQITKNFDKQIKEQADAVNKMQKQQGKGGKGGGDKSIDVETMKLKRLIDKRGQMFDMLRQVIDKYNETAKNMIQAIGR